MINIILFSLTRQLITQLSSLSSSFIFILLNILSLVCSSVLFKLLKTFRNVSQVDRFLVKSLVSSFSHRCNFYITPKQVLEKLKSVVVVLSLWFIQAIEHVFLQGL